jgi:hypothetical protein
MNECIVKLWHQDVNRIQNLIITRPTRGQWQAPTETAIKKRPPTTPRTSSILHLFIIPRKNPRFPHGTTLIPLRLNRNWTWIMAPTRTARDPQRL